MGGSFADLYLLSPNRANAQHSTGPKTEEGKANSCKNNTRWGFSGAFTVLPSESQEEFDTLLDRLRAEHKPQCIVEDILILKMAQHFWLSQRAQHCADLSMGSNEPHYAPEKLFPLFLRYQVTNDRAFHKSLDQLLKIRAQRFKEAIGFERQKEQMSRERERAEAVQNRERQRAELHQGRLARLIQQLNPASAPATPPVGMASSPISANIRPQPMEKAA